ncbi:MAG: N-acetyl-alpha-D-glucosaminyl L-malate synthase BshA [Candidatus Binatia bacterium]
MNVGVLCFASAGGSGTVATGLACELARQGHAVHVIAPARPFRLDPLPNGIRFHALCGEGDPAVAARSVADVALAERLDVLHAHYAAPHAVVACLARDLLEGRHRLTVVSTLHGTDVTASAGDASARAAIGRAIAASDGVTAVSRALADAAVAVFGVAPPHVIPNFVDPDAFRPCAAISGADRPERTLLHVSTLRPVKRAADCVDVLTRVADRTPCRLLIVGDGPDAATVRDRAAKLGVADRVELAGEQLRVADFLARADVLLMPSASESFGVAALEAMSCGVPVVASRAGGVPEVVEDGVCGRLLPVGDVDGMASAILGILADRHRARAMGEAGRRIAVERFDVTRIVPRYASFYREAERRACGAARRPA